MSAQLDVETVLADARQRAQLLRAEGHPIQAGSIERVCDEFAGAMRPFLTWLSESEAQLRSGWSVERLRSAFPEWEEMGCARKSGDGRRAKRQYREFIVPARVLEADARQAGLRGGSLKKAGGV